VTDEVLPLAASARPLWRNGDFVLLWSGQAVSTLGSTVSTLALPLFVLALTHSAAQAGFIAATQAIPYLVLALPAGSCTTRATRTSAASSVNARNVHARRDQRSATAAV